MFIICGIEGKKPDFQVGKNILMLSNLQIALFFPFGIQWGKVLAGCLVPEKINAKFK